MAGAALMDAEQWQLHVAAHVLCAVIFLILCIGCLTRVMEPLYSLQMAPLHARLHWCTTVNVYICFMSAVVNLFHITDFEMTVQNSFGVSAGIIKPLEYMLTCPLMMLSLVVLAGETVPIRRQGEVVALTGMVLLSGFFASLMEDMIVKMMLFSTGVLIFLALLHRVELNVRDHSGGKETLFTMKRHGSCYKKLCVKIVLTWVMFPVWWIFSAEGANIVEAIEINTLVSAILNIFAKGVYVVFVQRIHDRYIGSDSLMDPPKTKTHAAQDALLRAARLGPAGALESMAKEIKRQEEAMQHVRSLCVSLDNAKAAAMILSDATGSTDVQSAARPPRFSVSSVDDSGCKGFSVISVDDISVDDSSCKDRNPDAGTLMPPPSGLVPNNPSHTSAPLQQQSGNPMDTDGAADCHNVDHCARAHDEREDSTGTASTNASSIFLL